MSVLPTPLELVLSVIVFWLAIGALGILSARNLTFIGKTLFPFGAIAGMVIAIAGIMSLTTAPQTMTLPLGLPGLPFHLRIDALSGIFLLLLGLATVGVSTYSAGYFRQGEGAAPGLMCLEYHVYLASMATVLVADDAYAFMVAWETMAVSSYFLVTTEHRIPDIRRAGFLYLLIAHVGAVAILLSFGVMQGSLGSLGNVGGVPRGGDIGDYTFEAMRMLPRTEFWSTVAFLLALGGFGAKAGMIPLHVWLPEAHPAAPSPVSALMSGVMLKTAIYGLLRVTFDLVHLQIWWWGVLVLALGLGTALFGVVFSAVQNDMKRLLAYSSIENIGLILVGIGLAITFQAYGMGGLAAVALTAALYHCLNHACFKTLLFLVTGSVLHSTKARSLGKLGGLIHRMPWVAWLGLIGTLAIAGLPPLNGFVSEWLLLQAFLFTPGLPHPYLNMLIPAAAAALALAAALAGYVMVKFYGVVFLGQPREETLSTAKDAGAWERAGLIWLATWCVLLGLLPLQVIGLTDHVSLLLTGSTVASADSGASWLFLAPIDSDRASYGPLLFFAVILSVVLITIFVVRRLYHGRLRRAPAWDCGFPLQTSRMQDTAEGFGQPVRQVFEPFFRMERELPTPFDTAPHYRVTVHDYFWHGIYLPVAKLTEWIAGVIGTLQRGRISIYLGYSFLTLLALLLLVR